ncbi:MAG TPA: SDR family oxidoreductase [Planctomycetaceae bacterium]|jgi:nucleoside-diphosphate-sugar epimerase
MSSSRLIIGCGYLGRRVANGWLAEGDRVYALTRSPERAADLRQAGLIPIVGDVTNPATLPAFPEADTLLYAVGLDRRSGQTQREVYVGGLANVLPRIAGRVRWAIYISSTSVYGQNAGEWVDESSECRPEADNGQVCLEAERLFQKAIPTSNILRLAGIYGPDRLVARVESLKAGIVPDGNPEAWLNLIHVDDAVAAVLACEQHAVPGATYLVSDNKPCSRREYYTLLAKLIGAPDPFPPLARGGARGMATASSDVTHRNKRCHNRRLEEELQVNLRFPNIQTGLPDALAQR